MKKRVKNQLLGSKLWQTIVVGGNIRKSLITAMLAITAILATSNLANAVNVKDYGAQGIGGDDTAAIQAAIAAATASGGDHVVYFPPGTYGTATITITAPLELTGNGTILKIANTSGHLIYSTNSLRITGNMTLDANKANTPDPGNGTSACTIYHVGADLYINKATLMPSYSINIRSCATISVTLIDCNVTGGYMCVLANVGTNCKVDIRGGVYSNAAVDDNIQVHNSNQFTISGVTSSGAARSGIVVVNNAARGSIANCTCFDNKIDTYNQGGWGIVCSVATNNIDITGNHCYNNERGPLSIDTQGYSERFDAHVAVTGNVFDAEYNGGYGSNGIYINGSRRVTVTGNRIRKARLSILIVYSEFNNITGNTIEDCGDGYFVSCVNSKNVKISNNIFSSSTSSAYNLFQFYSSQNIDINDNKITGVAGQRSLFRFTDATNFNVFGNTAVKDDAGTGYVVYLTGGNSNGLIKNNLFRSSFNAFQWYICNSGTITDVITEHNEIKVPSLSHARYIYTGTSIVADGDTINGIKDSYSTAPTGWSFKTGQLAVIGGAIKYYNGSSWQ